MDLHLGVLSVASCLLKQRGEDSAKESELNQSCEIDTKPRLIQ